VQTAAENTLEFQNDDVKVTVNQKPGCQVRIDVEVSPKSVVASYDKGLKAVRKEVSVPGFRKGKVPDQILTHNFTDAIERESRDIVLRTAFTESIELAKIRPFTRNSLKRSELKKCSKETGATCIFELEVEPTVPTIDAKAIETQLQEPRAIDQKAIDRSYKQLQLMHATWEQVTGRPAEDGDYVELDIDVIENPAHNVCVNHLFFVSKDDLPKWLYDAVSGMQIDESKEVEAKSNASDPSHVISYEDNNVAKLSRVTLKAIKKANFPEENDEFAQKFGAPNVAFLKQFIEDRMKREEVDYAHELARYNLRRELIQKYPFDLPQSIVDAEVRGRVAYCKQGADLQKGSLPADGSKDKELKARIEAEARGFFMWMFLMRQISADANVTISQEELETEFNHQMQLPREQRLIYAGLQPDEVRNRLVMMIMMRKCEDHLLGQKST
jgi:trigger factor